MHEREGVAENVRRRHHRPAKAVHTIHQHVDALGPLRDWLRLARGIFSLKNNQRQFVQNSIKLRCHPICGKLYITKDFITITMNSKTRFVLISNLLTLDKFTMGPSF